MLIEDQKVARVLAKVRVARERHCEMWPPKDSHVLSVMDFHATLQDVYDLKIEMLKVYFSADHVRGKVERFAGGARILVRASQTPEFLRFVTVKELCHVMNDEEDDWSPRGGETISGLLKEWELLEENGDGHSDPSDPIKSEMLAEIAAIEMMYPREFRGADIQKIANKETTIQKIALQHEVPPYAIEQAHRHHDVLENCWGLLDAVAGE